MRRYPITLLIMQAGLLVMQAGIIFMAWSDEIPVASSENFGALSYNENLQTFAESPGNTHLLTMDNFRKERHQNKDISFVYQVLTVQAGFLQDIGK